MQKLKLKKKKNCFEKSFIEFIPFKCSFSVKKVMDDVNKNMDNTSEVLEIMSSSSLYDFMQNETLCYKEETSENCDVDSIFDEISRLTSLNDKKYQCEDENRTIEEIIKEVETLINQPLVVSSNNKLSTISGESTPFEIKNNILDQYDYSTTTTLHDVSLFLFRN